MPYLPRDTRPYIILPPDADFRCDGQWALFEILNTGSKLLGRYQFQFEAERALRALLPPRPRKARRGTAPHR